MHPLIARFLDLPATVAVLEKGHVPGSSNDPDEAALLAEAEKAPGDRAAILRTKGRAQPSTEVQQKAIVLLTRAASARLNDDATLGPKAAAARAALAAEGATAEEADALIAQVLLEEAFGYASDPSHFDADLVAETLDSLIPLSKLKTELVDDWLEQFAKSGPKSSSALRLSVAETVFEAAWSDGPQPISLEHLDDSLEQLSVHVASKDLVLARAALGELLAFLRDRAIIGPERFLRLTQLLQSASTEPSTHSDEQAEDEDE